MIDTRYREHLGVPALARAASVSAWHFSREFRREFGTSPHQYLLQRRLERAAALLVAGPRLAPISATPAGAADPRIVRS